MWLHHIYSIHPQHIDFLEIIFKHIRVLVIFWADIALYCVGKRKRSWPPKGYLECIPTANGKLHRAEEFFGTNVISWPQWITILVWKKVRVMVLDRPVVGGVLLSRTSRWLKLLACSAYREAWHKTSSRLLTVHKVLIMYSSYPSSDSSRSFRLSNYFLLLTNATRAQLHRSKFLSQDFFTSSPPPLRSPSTPSQYKSHLQD